MRALAARLAQKGEHGFHAAYLGAVAWEAHGSYRWAALACLVCVAIGAWLGGSEGDHASDD